MLTKTYCDIKKYILKLFKEKARPSAINTKKFEIRDKTTSQIIENINKTVGKLNTTKQRPLQGNGMATISKNNISRLVFTCQGSIAQFKLKGGTCKFFPHFCKTHFQYLHYIKVPSNNNNLYTMVTLSGSQEWSLAQV